MTSEILLRHLLGARRLATSWAQILNNAENAIEAQYLMLMIDLDQRDPAHLPDHASLLLNEYTHVQLSLFFD